MGQVHIHPPIITNDCKIMQLCGAISNKSLSLDISPLNLITSLILRGALFPVVSMDICLLVLFSLFYQNLKKTHGRVYN